MKMLLLLLSLVTFSSLGEILSARGMKQVGEISFRPRLLFKAIPRIITNSNLVAGVACLAFAFFSFLSLLSFADLSFVVPLTAVSYLTNTAGSKFLLQETISPARWWGTLLVTFGVAIISLPAGFEATVINHSQAFFHHLLAWLNPSQHAFTPAFSLLFALRLLCLILVITAIVYYLIAIMAGWLWARDRVRQRELGLNFTPPLSLLIPVRGVDFAAAENFASFCRQDYPDYQIIFGCRAETDPVIPIIKKLQADFPNRKIDLIVSDFAIGTNAKVANLHNMYPHAAHDYLLIVDSDIRVTADYLRRVVAPLQQAQVGMVTCLYRGKHAPSFAAQLENIGISANFGPEVMSSRALQGIKFALGSTIVTRRAIFEQIGGFKAVADYLADDYWLGNFVAAQGWQVILADYVVEHISGPLTMRQMFRHQLRWGRAIRISRPRGYFGLILTYGMATSLLLLIALGFSTFGWAMAGLTLLIRLLTAFYCGVFLLKDSALLKYLWLVPLRDLLGFGIWTASFFGQKIQWRGATFVVMPDGKIKPIPNSTSF